MDSFGGMLGLIFFTLVMLGLGVGAGAWWMRTKRLGRVAPPAVTQSLQVSSLQDLRAIGELSVFKAITKEIMTESGHGMSDWARKYFAWAFTKRKLAIIFEFEIDVRYDLRRDDFVIDRGLVAPMTGGTPTIPSAVITLPPAHFDLSIRNLYFYDEQQSKLLPSLLPSAIAEVFGSGFSEEDKNKFIAAAREHARLEAAKLVERYRPEIERSARGTLTALALSLGTKQVEVRFRELNDPLPEPRMAEPLDSAQLPQHEPMTLPTSITPSKNELPLASKRDSS